MIGKCIVRLFVEKPLAIKMICLRTLPAAASENERYRQDYQNKMPGFETALQP